MVSHEVPENPPMTFQKKSMSNGLQLDSSCFERKRKERQKDTAGTHTDFYMYAPK